jgi:hypothetical protein
MKVWMGALVMLLAGVSAGLAATYLEFRGVREYFEPRSRTKAGMPLPKGAEQVKGPLAVVVGGTKFDFGTLDYNQSRDQAFTIRNEGNEPLEVEWSSESCGKCIENKHKFPKTTVPPGGECQVIVTYAARKQVKNFDESANLRTNDPRAGLLQLQITGVVTLALKLDPETLALGTILATEPSSATVKLFGFQHDHLEFVKHELSDPSVSSLIELTSRPLNAEEIAKEEHARAGVELKLQLQPGLPIGPLSQTVKLTAKTDTEHEIELPIRATVAGDLSLFGKSYDANSATWSLGVFKASEGCERELFLLIKGPHREDVQVSVGEVDPADVMKVAVGEREALSTGRAIKVPIRVTIPPGTHASRLGTAQSPAARLVLETTHPTSKRIPLTVRFAVE